MLGLTQLDTVLSFTAVMLLLSVVITAIVQIAGTVFNTRGWVLVHGIKQVILQIAPGLEKTAALNVAKAVTQHPAITHQFLGRSAVAIRRDELVKLLQSLLAGSAGAVNSERQSALTALSQALDAMEVQGKSLAGRIDEWFDTIMDRSSELFTAWTQLITILVAFVLVGAWQIDALRIFDSLSNDRELRRYWVGEAQRVADTANKLPSEGKPSDELSEKELRKAIETARLGLINDRFGVLPPSVPGELTGRQLVGMVLAWLMLSLGAPFWFNLLRTLSNLRPSLARKADLPDADDTR